MSVIDPTRRSAWRERFVLLERGVKLGFRSSAIVSIQFFCAMIGLTAGLVLGLSALQWVILTISLTISLSTELMHQAFRQLCRCRNFEREEARAVLYLSSAATTLSLCSGLVVLLVVLLSRGLEVW